MFRRVSPRGATSLGILSSLAVIAIATLTMSSMSVHAAKSDTSTVHVTTAAEAADKGLALATFAGGCFWCTESDFRKVKGVIEVVSGFTGGHVDHPSYEQVSYEKTGHVEAVQVTYDPKVVGYRYLLDYYWRHVDPLDGRGQFADRGDSYRPVIFTHTPEQKAMAEKSRDELAKSGRFSSPIAVEIKPASTFWPAEAYHQDYAKKNSFRYSYYRFGSGRDARLDAVWGAEARGPRQEPAGGSTQQPSPAQPSGTTH